MKRVILYILLIIFSPSCEKKETNNYQIFESDLIVSMDEVLNTPSRIFNLFIITEKIYPCCNYKIPTKLAVKDKKIFLEPLGVDIQDICLTALGPAATTITIGNIEEAVYDIEFLIGTNKSYGKLLCSDSEFQLQMDKLVQLKINGSILMRIPDNLIWGRVGYHSDTSISLVDDFLNSLKDLGAVEISLDNGNYNYFEIENSKIKEPNNSGYYFTKSFVFSFAGDKNPIRSLVKEFSINHGDQMSIRVYGDKGEEYLGWVLRNE